MAGAAFDLKVLQRDPLGPPDDPHPRSLRAPNPACRAASRLTLRRYMT